MTGLGLAFFVAGILVISAQMKNKNREILIFIGLVLFILYGIFTINSKL